MSKCGPALHCLGSPLSSKVIYEISDFPLASAFSFPCKRFLGNFQHLGVIHYFKSLIARGSIHLSRVSSFFQKGLQDQTFRRGLIADASVIWGLMQKRGVRAGAGPNSSWCWASRSPHGRGSQCEHMRENLEVSLIVQGLLGVMFRQLLSIFPLLSFL